MTVEIKLKNGETVHYALTPSEIVEGLETAIIDTYFHGLSDKISDYAIIRNGVREFLECINTEDLAKQFSDEITEYMQEKYNNGE